MKSVSNRIFAIVAIFLFFSPILCQVVSASELTRDEYTIHNLRFDNPAPELFNLTLDLDENETREYSNFNYTEMGDLWGPDPGKFVYPLTPPIDVIPPENQTWVTYGSIFKLDERIFSGSSDIWIRSPFLGVYTGLLLTRGYYTVKVYRFNTLETNITRVTDNDLEIEGDADLIFYREYKGNLSGDDVDRYYFKSHNTIGPDGNPGSFDWLRVTAPISTFYRYGLFIKFDPESKGPQDGAFQVLHHFTEGDSFGDGLYNTWINLSSNSSIWLPFDMDVSLLVREIMYNGLVSQKMINLTEYNGDFYNINTLVNSSHYLNIVAPITVNETDLIVQITIKYSSSGIYDNYTFYSSIMDGEDLLFYSLDLTRHGYTIERISLEIIANTTNKSFTVWMVENDIGFDAMENGYWSSWLFKGGNRQIYNSSMPLYAYVSVDDFQIVNTKFIPILVPYQSFGVVGADLELIGRYELEIITIRERNERVRTFSLVLEEILKAGLAIATLPLKVVDMYLEYANFVYSNFIKWWEKEGAGEGLPGPLGDIARFINWLKDGIKYAIGFILEIAEIVLEWSAWAIYNLAKFFGLMMGIIIGIIIINGADAIARGVFNPDGPNPIEELAKEWRVTTRIITPVFVIVSFLFNLVIGIANILLPM